MTGRRMGGVIAFTMVLGAVSAWAQGRVGQTYQRVEVASGIYTFVAPESKSGFVSGNSTVIIGAEAALVVDSGHVPAMTRRMIAEIRELTDKPVRFLVTTHWHPDHVAGNGEYRAAFPGLTTIATTNVAQQIESLQSYFTSTAKGLPAYRDAVREQLTSGKTRSGAELTAVDRAFYQEQLADFEDAIPAFAEARVDPPNVTFDDALVVNLGKREVRILHPGRGNTAGDAVVFVPDAKVLVAGDLLVLPTPYAIGSFLGEWGRTMKKVLALDATSYVPGHGPVQRDRAYAMQLVELLEVTVAQVRAGVLKGLTLEQVRQTVDVSAFRERLAAGDPLRAKAFDDYFVTPGVERAFYEAKLELGGESRVINGR